MQLLDIHNDCLRLVIANLDSISKVTFRLVCKRTNQLCGKHVRIKLSEEAGFYGYVNILKWLKESNSIMWHHMYDLAAFNGHISVLEMLNTRRYGYLIWSYAVKGNQVKVLKWMRRRGDLCRNKYLTLEAARFGSLQALKWIVKHGCCFHEFVCGYAAKKGHLKLLRWLRKHGAPWSEYTCWEAARKNKLKVLQWLRKHKCPWNDGTCIIAAKEGHLGLLIWAKTNGCPWNEDRCLQLATEAGRTEVINWIRENSNT